MRWLAPRLALARRAAQPYVTRLRGSCGCTAESARPRGRHRRRCVLSPDGRVARATGAATGLWCARPSDAHGCAHAVSVRGRAAACGGPRVRVDTCNLQPVRPTARADCAPAGAARRGHARPLRRNRLHHLRERGTAIAPPFNDIRVDCRLRVQLDARSLWRKRAAEATDASRLVAPASSTRGRGGAPAQGGAEEAAAKHPRAASSRGRAAVHSTTRQGGAGCGAASDACEPCAQPPLRQTERRLRRSRTARRRRKRRCNAAPRAGRGAGGARGRALSLAAHSAPAAAWRTAPQRRARAAAAGWYARARAADLHVHPEHAQGNVRDAVRHASRAAAVVRLSARVCADERVARALPAARPPPHGRLRLDLPDELERGRRGARPARLRPVRGLRIAGGRLARAHRRGRLKREAAPWQL